MQPIADTSQVNMLCRSKMKRNTVPSNPITAKKSSKAISTFSSPSRPLTYHSSMSCQKKIDDVDTLEKLRKTGSYFDQLISGRFITTLYLPSPLDFINVVAASSRLEKKPLLKIRCKKSDKQFIFYFSDYILDCQLAFIFLDKLRKLDLVPEDREQLCREACGGGALQLEPGPSHGELEDGRDQTVFIVRQLHLLQEQARGQGLAQK